MRRAAVRRPYARPPRRMPSVPAGAAAPSESAPHPITAPVPAWAAPSVEVPAILPAAPEACLNVDNVANVAGGGPDGVG
jgi:hypothetical protein